jgi:hypothetical protein
MSDSLTRSSSAPQPSEERQINPAVKSWLDNVIIPAMVERYIIENRLSVENTETTRHDQPTSDAERSKT